MPHHHHHHGPHGRRNNGGSELFSMQVVGPTIMALLERPPETRETLLAIVMKRSPSDATALEEIIASVEVEFPMRGIVKKLAARKARDYYAWLIEASELNGTESATTAVILPLPPHLADEVQDANSIFVLRDHPIPHQ